MSTTADFDSIQEYTRKISGGLKGTAEGQKREILAVIGSHLNERIEEVCASIVRSVVSCQRDNPAVAAAYHAFAKTPAPFQWPWKLRNVENQLALNP